MSNLPISPTGRGIRVRHFRDGEELAPLAQDDYYDVHYQRPLLLAEERRVLPSDHLTVECSYDSLERNDTALGGLGGRDESCQVALMYYPRHSLTECSSAPLPQAVKNLLAIDRMEG